MESGTDQEYVVGGVEGIQGAVPAFKAKRIILCAFLDVSYGSPCPYFLFFP